MLFSSSLVIVRSRSSEESDVRIVVRLWFCCDVPGGSRLLKPGVVQRCPPFVSDTNGNLPEDKSAPRISTTILRAQVSRATVIQKPFGLSGVLICCRVPEHGRPGPGYYRSRSYQTCGSVLQLCLQNHSTRPSVLRTPAKLPLDWSRERTQAEQNM